MSTPPPGFPQEDGVACLTVRRKNFSLVFSSPAAVIEAPEIARASVDRMVRSGSSFDQSRTGA